MTRGPVPTDRNYLLPPVFRIKVDDETPFRPNLGTLCLPDLWLIISSRSPPPFPLLAFHRGFSSPASMYRKNSWLNDRFFPRWTFIGSMGRRRLLSGSRKCWRRERERKGKGRDREKVAIKRGKNIRRWNWEIYRVKRIETLTGSFLLDKIYFGSFFSLFPFPCLRPFEEN